MQNAWIESYCFLDHVVHKLPLGFKRLYVQEMCYNDYTRNVTGQNTGCKAVITCYETQQILTAGGLELLTADRRWVSCQAVNYKVY